MWPISQSVTHFFQALPVFSTCNSFSQVWPNFLSVTHFWSVKPFSRLTHFSKSESFFYVWPIFASEIFQVWLIFPRGDPSQLWHIFTSDPLFCFCFDPFLQVLPIFLRVTHFPSVTHFWKWDFPSVDEDWLAQLPDFSLLHPSPMPVVSNKTSKHYEN